MTTSDLKLLLRSAGFLPALVIPAGASAAADLSDLLNVGAQAERVATGFSFTEGPAYGPSGRLFFSDIPESRIVELLADGTTGDFLKPSGKANGLLFDAAGWLYACQGEARRVIRLRLDAKDRLEVLAAAFDGKKLNSPNDLALDGHGGLYFTDLCSNCPEPREQPVMGVYYIDAAGAVTRVIDKLERPNGILVSADGKRLYVAEPAKRQVYRYRIEAPGVLEDGEAIFTGDPQLDGAGPDGMALDALGNIYAAYKWITVLDPDGKLLGRLPVPEHPANCTFGGKEGKTLYITARKSLYAIAMRVAGAPLMASGPKGSAPPGPAPAEKPPGAAAREVKLRSLGLKLPAAWKEKEPQSPTRLGEFEIPKAAGDAEPAELVVFHFGERGAGTVDANVERWFGQFAGEGRKGAVFTGKAPAGEYVLVDLAGTYLKPVGSPAQRQSRPVPGSRVINVMLHAADGDYFLKLAGLEKTVNAALGDFRTSFGADPAKETAGKAPADRGS